MMGRQRDLEAPQYGRHMTQLDGRKRRGVLRGLLRAHLSLRIVMDPGAEASQAPSPCFDPLLVTDEGSAGARPEVAGRTHLR